MFCFGECLLLHVAEYVTVKFILLKSQACLTYVVLQPSRNKYFSYFPSSAVRLMLFFCFETQPFPLGLFHLHNLIKETLSQITSFKWKAWLAFPSPLCKITKATKEISNKTFKKTFETTIQTFVQLRGWGKQTNNKHTHFSDLWNPEAGHRFLKGKCTQVYISLHPCINPSANIIV